MARRKRPRQCKRCGTLNGPDLRQCRSCNEVLIQAPFRMTKDKIKYVHALAAQKGLDEVDYRARLHDVGATTSKSLKRVQYHNFVNGLKRLPDVPRRKAA